MITYTFFLVPLNSNVLMIIVSKLAHVCLAKHHVLLSTKKNKPCSTSMFQLIATNMQMCMCPATIKALILKYACKLRYHTQINDKVKLRCHVINVRSTVEKYPYDEIINEFVIN